MAQVEALLDLCLAERAHARLQGLAADAPDPATRARLAARVLLARGWHQRAADVCDHGLDLAPDDPELMALAAQAGRPAPPPVDVPPGTAPFDARLAAAEALLRTGSYTPARRLLDVLDREQPGHPRVADLLWGVHGHYDLPGTSLERLAATYGRLTPVDVPELEDDGPTDEVTFVPQALHAPPPAPDGAFPALFRGGRPTWDEDDEGDGDNTQAMRIAALDDLDTPFSEPRDEDTQILRVVSLGVEADAPAPVAPVPTPEDDEDGVVVLVRPQGAAPPPSTRRPLPSPAAMARPRREVLEEIDVDDVEPLEELEPLEPAPAPSAPMKRYAVAAAVVVGLAVLVTLALQAA